MSESYRYSDVQRAWGAGGRLEVSLNDLYPEPETDADGNLVPATIGPASLDASEKLGLLKPYVTVRFKDQLKPWSRWRPISPCFRSWCCANSWMTRC